MHGQKADLAIVNVTVIDGTGAKASGGNTILVKDGRFLEVMDEAIIFSADSIIDGSGKYMIPGLFDNHVHIGREHRWPIVMEQFLHFGITSVLIPGVNNQKFLAFKEGAMKGGLATPTFYHTSLMTTMEGKHPAKTYGAKNYIDGVNINYVKDESSIEPIITQAVKDQAIALKLMIEDGPQPPWVTRIPERYVALLAKKAHDEGLDFFAHISDMYEVRMAVKYDADALMHFMGVQIDWENDKDLLQQAADKGTSWVSTAMIGKSFFYMLNKQWLQNEHYSVFTEEQKAYFSDEDGLMEAESRAVLTGLFGSDQVPANAVMGSMLQDLKKLYDMGMNIVVGTDLGGRPFIMPGYSFHEEMQLFELGGFSPEEIIQCATLNAAKMLHVDELYGSVERGKIADFILLDKDPSERIENTLSIHSVYKEGIVQKRINNESNF